MAMPVVRSVTSGEVDRAGEIGAIAFGGELEGWQKAFHEFVGYFGTDSLLVVEHEGQIVSSMLLVGEDMWLGGWRVPARAVAAVGTVPEARCIGCAGAMMQEATRRMKAWGIAASPMWPFSFAYYRKFGWEIGGESRVVTWPRDIAFRIEPEGAVTAVKAADDEAMANVWDAVSPSNRCATARVPEHWKRLLRPDRFGGETPGKGGLLCRQGGQPAGYVLYSIPEPKKGEEAGPVDVAEFRALNASAEVALIAALSERLPQAQKFRAAFPAEHRLRSLAVNPRALETELHASFGFRVIDPAKVFPTMGTERALAPVRLRIEDEILGTKTFEICLTGVPAEAYETNAAPDVTCSIPAFSQVASGYLKVSEAATAGLLAGNPEPIARLAEATASWKLPFRSGLEEG
jgi:predicted acetyltransferase